MKKKEKAFLLSVLIFPGSGHILLKRYLSGFFLMGIAAVASYFLIYGVIHQALDIAEKIKHGDIYPDISAILELVSHQSAGVEFQWINTAMMVLLITWLIGIVDTYRVCRQVNRSTIDKK
ncbi:MAG: hypothetical protein QNK31_04280 [Porticoccus sp.]|nr:hypothetical protein [Porticoccus sp.]